MLSNLPLMLAITTGSLLLLVTAMFKTAYKLSAAFLVEPSYLPLAASTSLHTWATHLRTPSSSSSSSLSPLVTDVDGKEETFYDVDDDSDIASSSSTSSTSSSTTPSPPPTQGQTVAGVMMYYTTAGVLTIVSWILFGVGILLLHTLDRVICRPVPVAKFRLKRAMAAAGSYAEWRVLAERYDSLSGGLTWRNEEGDGLVDATLLRSRIARMRRLRMDNQVEELMALLRGSLVRDFAGMNNPVLYATSMVGTKVVVEEYVAETCAAIASIAQADESILSAQARFEFLYQARQVYGRSAILLSGGGRFGALHSGVLKELFDRNLLPRVMSGSSVGAMAASVCAVHTDEEARVIKPEDTLNMNAFETIDSVSSVWRKIKRLYAKGVLMDVNVLRECLTSNVDGTTTFAEAYARTNRIVNITISGAGVNQPPRLLNYLTAPNVVLSSAALASCAVPGIFEPVPVLEKRKDGSIHPWMDGSRWQDGSLETDVPKQQIAEMFNVSHFIVSQVNPHVVPFLNSFTTVGWYRIVKALVVSEVVHRMEQMRLLNLIPPFFAPLVRLISQTYIGDVTIIPSLTVWDYMRMLFNPSRTELIDYTFRGKRATWRKLAKIRVSVGIERALEQGVAELRTVVNAPPPSTAGVSTQS